MTLLSHKPAERREEYGLEPAAPADSGSAQEGGQTSSSVPGHF